MNPPKSKLLVNLLLNENVLTVVNEIEQVFEYILES